MSVPSNSSALPSAAVRRTATVVTAWWAASPAVFVFNARLSVSAHDHSVLWGLSAMLVWVGLTGVLVAPVAGLVLAYAGGHRRARRRFAVMGAVSLAVCFLFFVFWQFAKECPPGDSC
ncbi:hypothetical protein ACWGE1_11185 [Streptomyces sp. NPDC054932]